MLRTQFMIVMESDSMMMTAYAATWCSHSPFVKALLTPDDRMKPRPMLVPVETQTLSHSFRRRSSAVLLKLPVSVV